MKAYSYIRWSSAQQTEGDSLARQLATTRDICKQKGWQLDETFQPDAGVSGYSGDNIKKGSLAAFLAAVEQKRIKTPCVLVVDALDRLTRVRLREARKLFDGLLEKGVQICTANNGKLYDDASLDNPMDLLMSLMELNAANLYSKEIARKVRGAWARKKEAATKGILLTSHTPGWIKADRRANTAVLIPAKAAIVKRIFTTYLNGKGARFIMKELNRDGIPSFGNASTWNTTHINRLLRSGTVLGEYQPMKHEGKLIHHLDGLAIQNYYPAAIDKQTFYKVQEMLKAKACPQGQKSKSHNLFSGIAICARCGKKITYVWTKKPNSDKRYDWLRCDSSFRDTGCKTGSLNYVPVERGILTLLSLYIVLQANSRSVSSSPTESLTADLQHIQARLRKLKEMLEDPELISKTVLQSLRELETKEAELKEQIALAPAPTSPNPFSDWKPLANTSDNRIKVRTILRQAVESLVIDTDDRIATIKLKRLPVHLKLKWVFPDEGRNQKGQLIPRGQETFYINGKEQAYLDRAVIWESPENIKDPRQLMDVVLRFAVSNITMNADISRPKKKSTA